MDRDLKLERELRSFQRLWKSGYWSDIEKNNVRRLPEILRHCIVPYASGATALEIGPGRGAWTKKILEAGATKVFCLDALSAEHNHFWQYLGSRFVGLVQYEQVHDFNCSEVPDNSIDYLFSFDAFCHISLTGVCEYLKNLRTKIRPGANCFVMFADATKFRRHCPESSFVVPSDGIDIETYDGAPRPGRWYWIGSERFCAALERFGYRIISADLDVCPRDPICHFTRD